MGGKISSLIIWGFLLFMILHSFQRCLAARNLQDTPPPNGYNNDQSKSGVNGSQGRRDGSATGDNVPANGVVQTPPKSFYRSVTTNESSGSETTSSNINGVRSSTTKNWNDTQRVVDWNGHQIVIPSPSSQDHRPPQPEYEAPTSPEETPIYFPPPSPLFEGPPNSPFTFPSFPPAFSTSP